MALLFASKVAPSNRRNGGRSGAISANIRGASRMAPASLKSALNARLVPFVAFRIKKALANELEKARGDDVVGVVIERGIAHFESFV